MQQLGSTTSAILHPSLSNDEYHRHPAISSSGVKLLLDCPFKYWDRYLNPNRRTPAKTPSEVFGERVHTFLLEPEKFKKEYLVMPKVMRNEKSKAWQEQLTAAQGRKIIFGKDYEDLLAIRDRIENHPDARELLKGNIEHSIFWPDPNTGVSCRARPDCYIEDFIIDLKTTENGSPDAFARSIGNYGYHISAAMYLDAVEALTGSRPSEFVFVCIEKTYPYLVSTYFLDENDIAMGRSEYLLGLEIFKVCSEKNQWPTLREDIHEIRVPKYYRPFTRDNFLILNEGSQWN